MDKTMKNLILFIFFATFARESFSATCTSITRTNYTTNQVLTSSSLNSDFNNIYNRTNALDGGCITDGTLEFSAISAAQWGPVLKGIHQGCKVSYSDSNTISVGACLASVNGSLVETTSANTATWGCSGCSSELASTTYFAYIKNGSASSTLNVLISTTAPNGDGYDTSGNKVLARFFNTASSDIDQYSIAQWRVNEIDQAPLVAFVEGRKTSGTDAGTSSTNTVHTRELTDVHGDSHIVSLSTNYITLRPGKYLIEASAPSFQSGRAQLFLYSITDSAYVLSGKTAYSATADSVQVESFVSGVLDIATSKTYSLRHWINAGKATNGLGFYADVDASNPQSYEVYAQVKITQIKAY